MLGDYLRRTGFRRQLTIVISIAILGLAIFSSLMTSWEAGRRIRSYMTQQGERIAENLAHQSILALLYHSAENAHNSVTTTLAFPDVNRVVITDATYKILVLQTHHPIQNPTQQSAIKFLKPPIPLIHAMLEEETDSEWHFGAPVVYTGTNQTERSPFDTEEPTQPQLIGYVHISLSKNTLNRLLASLMIGNLILSLSFAAILVSIMRLLTGYMVRPLHALSKLMQRAEAGESGIRASLLGPKDIIEMAQSFNKMMDVLEERETELVKSRDAALHLAQMKAQFASTVSHEVRTPLNGVVGMLDILKATPLSKRQKEYIDVAWKSSHTLVELINNILDFSKMEAGKLSLEMIEFSLPGLIEEVVLLLSPLAQQKSLKLTIAITPDISEHLQSDPLRLRQVLINLMGNAMKFTDHGEIKLSVSYDTSSPDNTFLRFEVQDTGVGMNEEAAQRIFESYAQADNSTTRKYGGTGLGLAICKQLIELMGGEIGVKSKLGQGTTFWFTLHYYPVDTPSSKLVNEPSTSPKPSAIPILFDARPRILVVEDNQTNQVVAASMLTMNGCDYDFAKNGKEAIEAVKNNFFDLILMDCSMPEMDGYEATAHIRNYEQTENRHTPIIAMTANAQQGDAEKCIAAGMDDYLAKPILSTHLRQKLSQWLNTSTEPVEEELPESDKHQGILDQSIFGKLKELLGDTLPHALIPFLEDTSSYIAQLEEVTKQQDITAAQTIAHTIKGSSSNLGAVVLAQYAKEAEELAIQHRLEDIKNLLPKLQQAYEAVAILLEAEINTQQNSIPTPTEEIAQVLIVDDDRSTRNTLRYTLQHQGFHVEEASNGEHALTMLKCFQPDIILMDAMMPVMDGFIACNRIQENPQTQSIPVLMITALEDTLSIERAFSAGASDYITKPIHFNTLSQRIRRIIDGHRAKKHVHHLAYNDVLTGLPNRSMFFQQLEQAIEHVQPRHKNVAVIYLDIDRFKNVNETFGHNTGDRLLVAVAQRLRHSIRSTDFIARLGGDEFGIILAHITDITVVATAAQNIIRALSIPIRIDDHDVFITASLGISLYPDDATSAETLVKYADTAMYKAKTSTTDFQFFKPEMAHSINERNRLETDLRYALMHQELSVHYQPQAQLDNGKIIGLEALVRWKHPTRGFVSPVDFIPLAEEVGLISALGEWVMQTACKQLKNWIDSGIPPIRVAVNVSVRQILEPSFTDTVKRVLENTQLPPELLELEITESTLMENAQDTLAALHQLRKLGVRMSIDDFGTGYSSLAYLRQFPVDIIKIDRSFTMDVPEDTDAAVIVSAIIVLAHSLRLEVVAEGVETESQLRFLQEQHCDILQGYYLSKPVPPEALNQAFFLEHHFQNDTASDASTTLH